MGKPGCSIFAVESVGRVAHCPDVVPTVYPLSMTSGNRQADDEVSERYLYEAIQFVIFEQLGDTEESGIKSPCTQDF